MSLTRIALLLCLTGCAHAPGALGTARCLLASPAVDALTEDPTYPIRLNAARARAEQAIVDGKSPDLADLALLGEAAGLVATMTACGARE